MFTDHNIPWVKDIEHSRTHLASVMTDRKGIGTFLKQLYLYLITSFKKTNVPVHRGKHAFLYLHEIGHDATKAFTLRIESKQPCFL